MDTEAAAKPVDSYRFLDGMTKRMVKTWIGLARPLDIPWTPLTKPLSDCRMAMVTTGGIALKNDVPFDQEIERADPWSADPSIHIVPSTATAADIKVFHLHINPVYAEQDLGCVMPLAPLAELAREGFIGAVAPSHYSYMGYTLRPERLLAESVPAMIRHLHQEEVDVVILVPI